MAKAASGEVASDLLEALDDLTVPELDALIDGARRKREAKREATRKEVLQEVRARAQALGLPLSARFEGAGRPSRSDLEDPSKPKQTRASARVKYRNLETEETWTSCGSAPRWLRRLEEQGRGREEFTVRE